MTPLVTIVTTVTSNGKEQRNQAMNTLHRLHNAYGWSLSYQVLPDGVLLRKHYRGAKAGVAKMSLEQARAHWRRQLARGFKTEAGRI